MKKYKNLYEVRFNIKRGGAWRRYLIHIEAFNKKEAIQLAKDMWYNDDSWQGGQPHMFNLEVIRIPEDRPVDMCHWFVPCEGGLRI